MKKAMMVLITALAGLCLCLGACGSKDDGGQLEGSENARKGRIDQLTDEMAQDGVDYVQKPIDKARALQRRADERMEAMDEEEE